MVEVNDRPEQDGPEQEQPEPETPEGPRPAEDQQVGELEAPAEPAPPVPDEPAPPPVEESRARRTLRRGIRWVAGLLLVFALGALTVTLAFYLPTVRELSREGAERDQVQEQVQELEAEVADLQGQISTLEAADRQAAESLQDADLHVHILSALADIYAAQIALAETDPDGARLALTNTPETLSTLADLVGAAERDSVLAMEQRIDLALSLLDEDRDAAQSDLEVLANNLVKLENTYFVRP